MTPTRRGHPVTATKPAATMRAAADYLRERTTAPFLARLADWLDSAATDAEEIGSDYRAERVAASVLGLPDPWPDAKPPRRPEPAEETR